MGAGNGASVNINPSLFRIFRIGRIISRIFRVGRAVRLVRASGSLQRLFAALLHSLYQLTNVFLLLLLLWLVASIMAVQLFGELDVYSELNTEGGLSLKANFATFLQSS